MKVLADGVIGAHNYVEIKDFDKTQQYFIVVMGQAKYINTIKLYWLKGFEPASYMIEISQTLFTWEKIGIYDLKTYSEKDGLLSVEHKLNSKAAYFVRISIIKPKGASVRISEVELFPEAAVKLIIEDAQIKNIAEDSVDIVFNTSLPSMGYLRFGNSENNLCQNIGMEMDVFTTHSIHIGNLLKGTVYYFQPVVRDLNGNMIVGKGMSFKTRGIPLPLYISVQIQKNQAFSAELQWIMNVPCMSELFLGTSQTDLKIYYKNTRLQNENCVSINKLIPDTKFYYKILSTDKFNNKAALTGDFTTSVNNIALKKKVYGNFFCFPEGDGNVNDLKLLERITDGNYEINGHAGSGNINQLDHTAIIDLGGKIPIKEIKVIWRATAYSKQFDVYAGNDIKQLELVKNNIDSKEMGVRISSAGNQGLLLRAVSINANGREARYIKINVPKGSKPGSDLPFLPSPFLQLTEIEVFKVSDYGLPKYDIKRIK